MFVRGNILKLHKLCNESQLLFMITLAKFKANLKMYNRSYKIYIRLLRKIRREK